MTVHDEPSIAHLTDGPDHQDDAPAMPWAEYYWDKGWQAVWCQWHRVQQGDRVREGCTPLPGVTGRAAFLAPRDSTKRWMRLRNIGDDLTTGTRVKLALRPPEDVVILDVDDGYGDKSGAATIARMEHQYGPLPASWSMTARGAATPSRRIAYRVPAWTPITDRFFAQHGGSVEVVRTGHRYSWAAPSVHAKHGQLVGPVLWYEPGQVLAEEAPHIDDLIELPWTWVQAAGEVAAANPELTAAAGAGEPITERHAVNIVSQVLDTVWSMSPVGGAFRNAVFNVGRVIGRWQAACGHTADQALEAAIVAMESGPMSTFACNADDVQWLTDGVAKGYANPWVFVPELPDNAPSGQSNVEPDVAQRSQDHRPGRQATDDEVDAFLATYTRSASPAFLGRRRAWITEDTRKPGWLARQAHAVLRESLAGHYPAERGVLALLEAHRAAGNPDQSEVKIAVSTALHAVLTQASVKGTTR